MNIPRLAVIQPNGKYLTKLHKFLARAVVPFIFRCSLPLFRYDASIFELPIKSISVKSQYLLSLLLTSLTLSLKSSSSKFIMHQNATFMQWSFPTSFIAFTIFFFCLTMLQLFCESFVTV